MGSASEVTREAQVNPRPVPVPALGRRAACGFTANGDAPFCSVEAASELDRRRPLLLYVLELDRAERRALVAALVVLPVPLRQVEHAGGQHVEHLNLGQARRATKQLAPRGVSLENKTDFLFEKTRN